MVEAMIEKGNVLVNDKYETHALVLALTKDGKRAKLHVYGRDGEPVWHPVAWYSIAEAGLHTCWKCSGSGKFYSGSGTLNGVFQGHIGICFACQGKGKQDDADRIRCWGYWHRGRTDAIPADFTADGNEDDSMPYGPMDGPDTSDFA